MTLDEIDELDTVEVWAKYYKVSRDTAFDFAKSGMWPSSRFGRNIRIRKSAMLQRIEEMERNPAMAEQLQVQYSAYWKLKVERAEGLA